MIVTAADAEELRVRYLKMITPTAVAVDKTGRAGLRTATLDARWLLPEPGGALGRGRYVAAKSGRTSFQKPSSWCSSSATGQMKALDACLREG